MLMICIFLTVWTISHAKICGFFNENLDVLRIDKGRHHNAAVRFCACESEASTLVRYRPWTKSSNLRRRAVHFDLLNLIHYSSRGMQNFLAFFKPNAALEKWIV